MRRARVDAGPGDRRARSCRSTCCAPRARRTSGCRRRRTCPGGQGVGVVEASRRSRRRVRACGSSRRPGCGPATAAWPSCAWCRTRTSYRSRRRCPTSSRPRSGSRASRPGWRCRGGPGCSPASGCWCSGAAVRSARPGSARPGCSAPPPWSPSPGRRRSTGPSAAGADLVVPLERRRRRPRGRRWPSAGPFDVVLDPVWGDRRDRGLAGPAPRAAGWSTSAARRATRRRTPVGGAAQPHRRPCSATPTTPSTSEQRAEAITAVLGHAAAGRIRMAYDVRPLAEVEDGVDRKVAGESEVRCVLVP